jgi:hypothetical protein
MKTYRLDIVGLGRMGNTFDADVEGYPAVTLSYSIAAAAKAIPQLELVAGCNKVLRERCAPDGTRAGSQRGPAVALETPARVRL